MTLQTDLNTWESNYDSSGINSWTVGSNYIGSVKNGTTFESGLDIYQTRPGVPSGNNNYTIHDFEWYAGQGVVTSSSIGSKYLVHSDTAGGFSWDTIDVGGSGVRMYNFVTTGRLDTIYLGSSSETSESPSEVNLNAFVGTSPLLVIDNFYVAANYVGNALTTSLGLGSGHGNSLIPVLGSSGVSDWLSNEDYYQNVTINSAVLYGLAFPDTTNNINGSQTALEYVLDTYLQSLGQGVSLNSSYSAIETALLNVGSDLTIDYYSAASNYPGSEITTAFAPSLLAEDALVVA